MALPFVVTGASLGQQQNDGQASSVFASSQSPKAESEQQPILGNEAYVHDDGTTDEALGLVEGGEMAWIARFERDPLLSVLTGLNVTFGDPNDPGGSGIQPGQPFRFYVWSDDDNDGNPQSGTTLLFEGQDFADPNAIETDLMQTVLMPDLPLPTEFFYIGVSYEQPPGFFGAPMDQSQPSNGRAWVSGTLTPPFNPNDFSEGLGIFDLDEINFPAVWRLRGLAVPEGGSGGGRYFGIEHQPLGNASLNQDQNGHLVVSNIGSSGKDGVSIDLGETEAFITQMPLPLAAPQGASVQSALTGAINGIPDQSTGQVGVIRSANGYDAIVDFSDLGSPTYTAQIFQDDALVFEQSGLVNGDVELRIGVDVEIDCDCTWTSWCWTISIEIEFGIAGNPVPGNHVVFLPDVPQTGVGFLTNVDLTATNMDPIVMLGEELRLFHNDHRALGAAHMDAGGDHLVISNIGSSGQDGVSIDLGDESIAARLETEPIAPAAGDEMRVSAFGTLDGIPGSPLGNVSGVHTGTGIDMYADFSDLGNTLVRVEVYDFGVFVGSEILPEGLLGSITPGPNGLPPASDRCGKRPGRPPFAPPCYWVGSPYVVTFTSSAGTVYLGNELRMLAVDTPAVISGIEAIDVTAAETDPLTITRDIGLPDVLNMDRLPDLPDADPRVPVTDPTGPWHELYPIYCNGWECDDWIDTNGDGELGVCDWVHFKKNSDDGDGDWYHIEDITITITISEQAPPFELFAMDYTGDDINGTMDNPQGSQWHEVYPHYCTLYNQKQYQDSGEPGLSEGDKVFLVNKENGEGKWYRVDAVSTDITIKKGDPPPPPTPCPADLNNDDVVNVNDLLQLLAAWGTNDPNADINNDGSVDVNDLLQLLAAWGDCP